MKRLTYLLTIIVLLIGISPVYANTNDNIVDFTKKGTITITLSDNSNTSLVEGANIKIYKLADAYSKDYNLDFNYNENLEECITNIKENNLNQETLECIHESNLITEENTTNNSGYTAFNNLDLGLYLIEQTNKVDGYSKIEPFLVYIPQIEESNWIYEINATPKVDIIRLMDVIVEKKWDSVNSESTPESVTIELLKGEEVIETIILNKENNWTYTWIQIEESDEYSVKEKDVPAGYTDTYRQVGNKFIVTNTKTLVQTGQNILIIEILTIFGLIFIVAGYILNKRNNY